MKFRKIMETCIYSSDLQKMKKFYVDMLGLEFVAPAIVEIRKRF